MAIIFEKDNKTLYSGLCLFKWERNYYDDSDFYMRVWDVDNNTYMDVMTGTTRCASGNVIETVDATDEIRELYRKDLIKRDQIKEEKKFQFRVAQYSEMGISEEHGEKLFKAVGENAFYPFYKLLSANLRSEFRKSLKNQVINWLSQDNPKYDSPLSDKQISYI